MENLNYLMSHTLFKIFNHIYQMFKINVDVLIKNKTFIHNSPVRIYLNKIENRTTFNTFTVEGFSETRSFIHLSDHVFWSQ